jgi:hypothetical protein
MPGTPHAKFGFVHRNRSPMNLRFPKGCRHEGTFASCSGRLSGLTMRNDLLKICCQRDESRYSAARPKHNCVESASAELSCSSIFRGAWAIESIEASVLRNLLPERWQTSQTGMGVECSCTYRSTCENFLANRDQFIHFLRRGIGASVRPRLIV